MQISKARFKPRMLEHFRRVEATGEELIITDHGRPVVRVTRYQEAATDPFRALRGSVRHYHDPELPVAAEDWEAVR